MAVNNIQFANNSYKVIITNELTGSNNIISGVNTAITTLGWSLFDSVDQTTYSPMVTRVYRAANVDANSFKYAILRFDTLKLRINLSCAESWNTTTKVATNESWHNDGCFYHGYDVRNSFILVNATARHLLLQTYIINEPGHWGGVFETERVAAEDIASNTAPCFFYTNSLMFGTPWGIDNTRVANTSQVMMAFPRTPDNQVDYFAASMYAPTTSRGMWPPFYPSGNTANVGMNSVTVISNTDLNNLHLGSWWMNIGAGIGVGAPGSGGLVFGATAPYGGVWGWDGSEIPISPVSVDAIRKHMPFGRVYDMSITRPIGGTLDTTYFTANTVGGWVDNTGSNTEFLLMPLHGGNEQWYSNNYILATGNTTPPLVPNSGITVFWSNNSNVVYSTIVPIGNNVWAAANNGVWVWSQHAGMNTTSNLVYFNANAVLDIMFDGARSVYATTNTGLIQIDTETYATNIISSTAMTDQGGTSYLNMDNRFIYAVNRTANTRPYCHMVYRANNTVAPNVIQMASGVALNVASGWNTPMPDYQGFVYLSNSPGTTSSQQKRMLVANVDGANSGTTGFNTGVSNTTQPWFVTAAHGAQYEFDNIWVEYNSNRVYHFQITSSAGYVQEYEASTKAFTLIANTAQLGTSFYVNSGCQSNMAYFHQNLTGGAGSNQAQDFRGDLNIMQHRGMFHIQPKFPGRSINASSFSFVSRFVLHHPYPNISNTNKIMGQISRTYEAGNTVSSALTSAASTDLRYSSNFWVTNGIRVFNNHYVSSSNTESRIQVQKDHFMPYPFGGYPTGRLLIKA